MDRLFTAKTKSEKTVKLVAFIAFAIFTDIIAFFGARWAFSVTRILESANNQKIGTAVGSLILGLFCLFLIFGATLFAIFGVVRLLKSKQTDENYASVQVEKSQTENQSETQVVEHSNRREEQSESVVLSKSMYELYNLFSERKEEYTESVNLITLKDQLTAFSRKCGLEITDDISCELISAIASSRLILLSGERAVRAKMAEILGAFFGFKTFINENTKSVTDYEGLLYNQAERKDTDVALGLYSAINRKNALNFIALLGADLSNIDKYFKKFQSYLKAPRVGYSINLDVYGRLSELKGVEKGYISIPQNVWYVLDKEESDALPYIYAKYATEVNLSDANLVGSFEVLQNQPCPSFKGFIDAVEKVNQEGGLSLENWKKLDKIEAYFNGLVGFSIDNRTFLQFERYTASLVELKKEENQVLDKLVANKLLQIVACYNKSKIKNADKKLDQVLFTSLGDGNCELSLKSANSYNLL